MERLSNNRKWRDFLHDALRAGKLAQAKKALSEDAVDVFTPSPAGDLLFHLAVEGGAAMVQLLLDGFPQTRSALFRLNASKQTALQVAIARQEQATVRVFAQDVNGDKLCLHLAVMAGHLSSAEALLAMGADPNRPDGSGVTPLYMAAERGHHALCQLLLERGANAPKLVRGLSALHCAAVNGHVEVCSVLLAHDRRLMSGLTPKGNSVLHVAAKAGRAAVCVLLLECGADVRAASPDGHTPLHVTSDAAVCRLLLDAGADAKAVTKKGESVIQCVLAAGALDVATFLFERGAVGPPRLVESVVSLVVVNQFRDSLPVWIGALPNLITFKAIEGNPLRSIPRSVLANRDDFALLQYLRDLGAAGQKACWKGFKILTLGKEGVGKTHLYHLVSGKKYARNESTDGVEIHSFHHEASGAPVTWFDFGGQEVFYPTHQLFLTSSCVCLICFRLDLGLAESRLLYWLKCVESYASAPPRPAQVVIVGTHLDRIGKMREIELQAELGALLAGYNSVASLVFISCVENAEVSSARINNAIWSAARSGGLGDREVPKSFLAIVEWVREQRAVGSSRLHFDMFSAHFVGYDKGLLQRCCEFLHDSGDLFYAKRSAMVFVNVQWLAQVFAALVTFKHNWIRDGSIHQKELNHVWRDFQLGFDDVDKVMEVFEKFEIAFRRRGDGVWLVPSMLPVERPAVKSGGALTHQRIYRFRVVPAGSLGRIMARVQEWSFVDVVAMWRNGIIVRQHSTVAHLILDDATETMVLSMFESKAGPPSVRVDAACSNVNLIRRFDTELQSVTAALAKRMWSSPMECDIVCPHCLSAPGGGVHSQRTTIPYKECVQLVLSGSPSFKCNADEIPLRLLGDDLTFEYVRVFPESAVRLAASPFASGAFGEIFKCKLDGEIAVAKVLRISSDAADGLEGFRDFEREIAIMSQLHHPNIVELYGVMVGPLRMILQYCRAGDLLSALRSGALTSPRLKERVAQDVARGMAYLHAQHPPIAHRDLRSPNVLLSSVSDSDDGPCAKVADFGLSVSVSTQLKDPLLTWQWMAPEAYLGENYTETCDLYSFAIVLWEIFTGTGEIPFQAFVAEKTRTHDLINSVVRDDLRPVCGDDIPPHVVALIRKLWLRDPRNRPIFSKCVRVLERAEGHEAPSTTWEPYATPKPEFHIHRLEMPLHMDEDVCVFYVGSWCGKLVSLVGTRTGKVLFRSAQTVWSLVEQVGTTPVTALALNAEGLIMCGCENGVLHLLAMPSTEESKPAVSPRFPEPRKSPDARLGRSNTQTSPHADDSSHRTVSFSSSGGERLKVPLLGDARLGRSDTTRVSADDVDQSSGERLSASGSETRLWRSNSRASPREGDASPRNMSSSSSGGEMRKIPLLGDARLGRSNTARASADDAGHRNMGGEPGSELRKSPSLDDSGRCDVRIVSLPLREEDASQRNSSSGGEPRKSPLLGGARIGRSNTRASAESAGHRSQPTVLPAEAAPVASTATPAPIKSPRLEVVRLRGSPAEVNGAAAIETKTLRRKSPLPEVVSQSAPGKLSLAAKLTIGRSKKSPYGARSEYCLHSAAVTHVVSLGAAFVSVDASGTLAVSHLQGATMARHMLVAPCGVGAICAVSDGACWIACAKDILLLRLADAAPRLESLLDDAHSRNICDMAFGTDRVFTCCDDEIRVWATSTASCLRTLRQTGMARISSVALVCVHGEMTLWTGGLRELRCWSAVSGRLLRTFRDIDAGDVERIVETGEDSVALTCRRADSSLALLEWDLFV